MDISIKQLNDIISLSVLAICKKDMDGTATKPNSDFSPVEIELMRILNPKASCDDIKTINDHIAAIRLGMRIAS